MKSKLWLWLPVAIVVGVFAFYAYQVSVFQDHFFNKTTIGSVDVGQLTKAEAKEKLATQLKSKKFDIKDNQDIIESIPKNELGITYEIDKTVDHQMAQQNPWLWFMTYLPSAKTVHAIESTSTDEKVLDQKMATIKEKLTKINESRTHTTDAQIVAKDGDFSIEDEVQGTDINIDDAIKAIKKDIQAGKSDIDLNQFVKKPTITASDKQLTESLSAIEQLTEKEISYSINGEKIIVPKETVAEWVTYKDGKVDLKTDVVTAYVSELGQKYNTSTNPTNFKSTKRGEVSVPAGAYSWTINTDAEAAELTKQILSGKEVANRVPLFQGSASPASSLIGNTYIEVDLQAQHMWLYQDGKVTLDTPVITGKPSTPTPPGVFYVWNKERDAILRGEDYASPVDFWMPIDWTGVGIHDSPWQNANAYGGTSYKTVGSHGCINTPPAVCAKLFSLIDTGIPVVVF
ncbi:hypothetical protein CBF34_04980 [Vagococcus penaei]|uniref:L,D-TPase catalytic domain-containing protein n=1 Tax=Vagococcus penaei TaxID=633807 RepID=A0A1Q2D6K7_9ENTE|nr:L,D-transpeptidase family protein [Vagococcus penaei]AQP53957.1 hypothetical protein BW732_06810 [Vagococcus penaei]RSU02877.1 hypothetical protein CBF34_04980 [Vagococcus penaei]